MEVNFKNEFYDPLLLDILKYYITLGNTVELPPVKSVRLARKYLERTRYSDEEIITKSAIKLKHFHFQFAGMRSNRQEELFVKHFEDFIRHIVEVIGYLNGTIRNL